MAGLRWQAPPPAPSEPPRCDGCGAANAPFGIGPPAAAKQGHYCATCNQSQPATQRAIAEAARAAIGGEDE